MQPQTFRMFFVKPSQNLIPKRSRKRCVSAVSPLSGRKPGLCSPSFPTAQRPDGLAPVQGDRRVGARDLAHNQRLGALA